MTTQPKHHPERPYETHTARKLRRQQTKAELELWMRLRGRQLQGHKFRRQYPVAPYYADFCCLEAKLIIELDGGQHSEQVKRDEIRTTALERAGFAVVRFSDSDMLARPDAVMEVILRELDARTQRP